MTRRVWLAVLAGVLVLAPPAAAEIKTVTPGPIVSVATDPSALQSPPSQDTPPAGYRISADQAFALARRELKVREELNKFPGATHRIFIKGFGTWQISYYAKDGKEIAQILVNDRAAEVREVWTGFQVAWTMARGYPGAFGRKSNALYIWIPLCLLFFAPFFNWRRPFRMLHLDLLVLLSLSLSFGFFNQADLGKSVPFSAATLIYLTVRMLWLARSRKTRSLGALKLLIPVSWLAVLLLFVVGFRVGLNVVNSNVIDVGYSNVIGADRLSKGQKLYASFPKDNPRGDTYGPTTYFAYIPFEQIFPWHGKWDDLPSAHAAAIVFDLLTIVLLFLLGRQIRGPTLGVVLAYGWATFPFTLLVQSSNSNDALVALLLVAAMLALRRPAVRGVLVALVALTKIAPLVLVPLYATFRANAKRLTLFALTSAATAGLLMLPVLLGDQLQTMYERIVTYQADRDAPFSIWGYYDISDVAQHITQGAAVVLALVAAFIPRKTVVQWSALAAAVLLLLELSVTYWFYLYIVWFIPFVLVALFARYETETT